MKNVVKNKKPEKRRSILEMYYVKGFLNRMQKKWSPDDRLLVANKLYKDYYLSQSSRTIAIDYAKDRVDNSIKSEPAFIMDARDRYINAMEAIPNDYREIIYIVCCMNKPIQGIGITKRQCEMDWHRQMCDLCRGLDSLIVYYLKQKKKRGN